MNLLVDNQLPEALARYLDSAGLLCRHVRDLGLQRASDSAIWAYAREHGYVLVSKDEDFVQLADRYGAPPQVVWVRLGNCRKPAMLAAFQRILPALRESLALANPVTEVR